MSRQHKSTGQRLRAAKKRGRFDIVAQIEAEREESYHKQLLNIAEQQHRAANKAKEKAAALTSRYQELKAQGERYKRGDDDIVVVFGDGTMLGNLEQMDNPRAERVYISREHRDLFFG